MDLDHVLYRYFPGCQAFVKPFNLVYCIWVIFSVMKMINGKESAGSLVFPFGTRLTWYSLWSHVVSDRVPQNLLCFAWDWYADLLKHSQNSQQGGMSVLVWPMSPIQNRLRPCGNREYPLGLRAWTLNTGLLVLLAYTSRERNFACIKGISHVEC